MCWCLLTAYEKAYGMKDATSNKPGADLHRDDGLSAFLNPFWWQGSKNETASISFYVGQLGCFIDLKINAGTKRRGRVGVTPAASVINSHANS